MKFKHPLLLTSALLALGAITSEAASILTYTPQSGTVSQSGGTHTIGSRIQVNVTGLSITQLGVMDTTGSGTTGSDGFVAAGNVSVGIWSWDPGTNTASATPLAQATVGDSDTLIGGYRYVTLATPLALISGQQYLIGAYVGGGIEWWLEDNTLNGVGGGPEMISASSGDFTLLDNRFVSGSFGAPVNFGGGTGAGRWGAANAMVVPEASSALLGGLGLLALLRRRR